MKKNDTVKMKRIFVILFCIGIAIAAFLCLFIWQQHEEIPPGDAVKGDIAKFSSEEECIAYLSESSELTRGGYAYSQIDVPLSMPIPEMQEEMAMPVAPPSTAKAEIGGGAPSRVSTTTVQVLGIDEPDVVKTDGKHIYFSSGWGWDGETKIIAAFPPSNLSIKSELKNSGDMLLKDDTLVIFSGEKIYGYNVSDRKSPEEDWEIKLNGTLVSARLYNGSIYLVTKNWIDRYDPLPIYPMTVKGKTLVVRGTEIYHPTELVPADVVYTAAILDPEEGEITNNISFLSSYGMSVIYMSENALYIAYTYHPEPIEIYYKFLTEKCSDIIPADVMNKIDRLMDYDISNRAKMVELESILASKSSYSADERLRMEKEMYKRMDDYYDEYKRELETTGIVKIGLDDFEMAEKGEIPGRPLNQFSLDEYEGYLRVATTVGSRSESANDVYVLNEELEEVGSVKDLGITEQIYAVRFIGDKGYVVTYREIDPFYIIDLSNPEEPELKGELKIPGYSSYLHPITEDLILGIGREDWDVKISLFDVSNPSEPVEADKYILEESWSDVLETHHAFLIDNKHKIFFLPGHEGGYIFSYADEKLEMVKAVSAVRARRAVYMEDYLYIIADTKLVVLDEETWEKVNEIEFDTKIPPYPPMPIMEKVGEIEEIEEKEINN